MGDWPNFENRAVIGKALRLRREIDEFEARWPALAKREELLPGFSWTQLERQLVDLSATGAQADMARHLVSATRKGSNIWYSVVAEQVAALRTVLAPQV